VVENHLAPDVRHFGDLSAGQLVLCNQAHDQQRSGNADLIALGPSGRAARGLLSGGMTNQTTFAHAEFAAKKKSTRRERFLDRREEAIPWAQLLAVVAPRSSNIPSTS